MFLKDFALAYSSCKGIIAQNEIDGHDLLESFLFFPSHVCMCSYIFISMQEHWFLNLCRLIVEKNIFIVEGKLILKGLMGQC